MVGAVAEKTGNNSNVEAIVDALREEGVFVSEFSIRGETTYWRDGQSLGEPVYHSVCDQGGYKKGQESMLGANAVHYGHCA